MLNQYPAWKYLLLLVILVTGIFFALPNIFGESPAVQISGERGIAIDEDLRSRVETCLLYTSPSPRD